MALCGHYLGPTSNSKTTASAKTVCTVHCCRKLAQGQHWQPLYLSLQALGTVVTPCLLSLVRVVATDGCQPRTDVWYCTFTLCGTGHRFSCINVASCLCCGCVRCRQLRHQQRIMCSSRAVSCLASPQSSTASVRCYGQRLGAQCRMSRTAGHFLWQQQPRSAWGRLHLSSIMSLIGIRCGCWSPSPACCT